MSLFYRNSAIRSRQFLSSFSPQSGISLTQFTTPNIVRQPLLTRYSTRRKAPARLLRDPVPTTPSPPSTSYTNIDNQPQTVYSQQDNTFPPNIDPTRAHVYFAYQAQRTKAKYVVGAIILLCTGVYSYKLYAEQASTAKSQASQFSLSRLRQRVKTKIEIYRENFICSRENFYAGRWWVLLTHTLAHGNEIHLALNMWALWSVGRSALHAMGGSVKAFTAVWILTGVGASSLDVFWPKIKQYMPQQLRGVVEEKGRFRDDKRSVGASAVIFGLFGFITAAMPKMNGASFGLAIGLEVLFMTYDILPMFNHTAHIAGAAIGFASFWPYMLMKLAGRRRLGY